MTFLEMPEIQPMIIAIWCGIEKPKNLNEFLRPFVTELNEILRNGININGYSLTVSVHCFVCDTPARAFIKGNLMTLIFVYISNACNIISNFKNNKLKIKIFT